MMTDDDIAEIARVREAIREDRPASIVLRRADATLVAQPVRIARLSNSSRFRSESGGESRGGMLVSGASNLNIALDDRFTLDGAVYRIKFVRPNRDTGTQAEAELVQ